ncbi:MAG: MFS transporter [Clostridia bacterium]|nr:MFS transporter [Clostridia bacterium]
MKEGIRKKTRLIAYLLALVYFTSYATRINFAVMLVKVYTEMGIEKSAISIVITGLTLTYGAGQIISGLLGDKIKPQHLLSSGLGLASLCNVAMFFCQSVPSMTVVWCVNGFAQALLWPPIVRLMATYLTDTEYSYAVVRVSWGSSVATIALYLICPALLHVMSWRTIMVLCAALGLLVTVFWTAVNGRLFNEPIMKSAAPVGKKKSASALPGYVYLPIVLIMLGIIMQGMLRDGVTNWMPTYLLETFHLPEENAIVATVILAVFSMVSFSVFDLLQRKVFQNEVFCAAMIFLGSAVFSAILLAVNVFFPSAIAVTMVLMALVVGAMHGINLMLISIVPKRFAKTGKVSTYSGLLNACTYIGAAISTYGFASLAESFGWSFTILTWVIIAVIGLALCFLAAPLWKRFKKDAEMEVSVLPASIADPEASCVPAPKEQEAALTERSKKMKKAKEIGVTMGVCALIAVIAVKIAGIEKEKKKKYPFEK